MNPLFFFRLIREISSFSISLLSENGQIRGLHSNLKKFETVCYLLRSSGRIKIRPFTNLTVGRENLSGREFFCQQEKVFRVTGNIWGSWP